MKHHDMTVSPNRVTLDGVDLTVLVDPEPTIESLGDGLSIVTVGIACDTVILDGDKHDHPEPTPIYDELMGEKP